MNVLFEGYIDAAFRGIHGWKVKSQFLCHFWVPEWEGRPNLRAFRENLVSIFVNILNHS
jgi:hypothetical protein